LVDVTGIEPVPPACKARAGIKSKSLFRLRLTPRFHQNKPLKLLQECSKTQGCDVPTAQRVQKKYVQNSQIASARPKRSVLRLQSRGSACRAILIVYRNLACCLVAMPVKTRPTPELTVRSSSPLRTTTKSKVDMIVPVAPGRTSDISPVQSAFIV